MKNFKRNIISVITAAICLPGLATQVLLPSPVKDLLEDGSLERV